MAEMMDLIQINPVSILGWCSTEYCPLYEKWKYRLHLAQDLASNLFQEHKEHKKQEQERKKVSIELIGLLPGDLLQEVIQIESLLPFLPYLTTLSQINIHLIGSDYACFSPSSSHSLGLQEEIKKKMIELKLLAFTNYLESRPIHYTLSIYPTYNHFVQSSKHVLSVTPQTSLFLFHSYDLFFGDVPTHESFHIFHELGHDSYFNGPTSYHSHFHFVPGYGFQLGYGKGHFDDKKWSPL